MGNYYKIGLGAFLCIVVLLVMGCGFIPGYNYHEQNVPPIIKERIVYVDRPIEIIKEVEIAALEKRVLSLEKK